MKNKLWFKRKTYGYGWYPITIEGWSVIFVFLAFNIWNFIRLDINSHSSSDTLLNFIPITILTIIILIAICIKKGEKPRWQWGKSKR